MFIAEATTAPPLWAVLAPFLLAILFLLASPLLTKLAKQIVRAEINADSQAAGQPVASQQEAEVIAAGQRASDPSRPSGAVVPAAVAPETIADYIEHAVDVTGYLPATLLPVSGVIFALTADRLNPAAVALLFLFVFIAVIGWLWILTTSSQNYASRTRGLSRAAWVILLANVFSVVVLVVS